MRCRKAAGFTLVEMLVSVAVLVILILLVTQLFNSATATATLSRKDIDADEAARLVFDRMGSDFAAMVRRPDVSYVFCKSTSASHVSGSSDAMFFYSEGPGYLDPGAIGGTGGAASRTGSASPVALIGYRINASNQYYQGVPVMERLGENLTWSGAADNTAGTYPGGMVFLPSPTSAVLNMTGSWFPTLPGNWSFTLGVPPYNGPGNQSDQTHYQVLSDSVFRMEFCFLLKSGTYAVSGSNPSIVTAITGYSNSPTAIPPTIPQPYITKNYFKGAASPDLAGNVYGFPPDLGGIDVCIAVLDSDSRKIVGSGSVSQLASKLSDSLSGITVLGIAQANPQTTAQLWQGQLVQSGFAPTAGVPQIALAHVRVYNRTFYLDAN